MLILNLMVRGLVDRRRSVFVFGIECKPNQNLELPVSLMHIKNKMTLTIPDAATYMY